MTAHLFSPIRIGGLDFPNRIAVAPMCQYSADDGSATDWHLQHWMMLAMSGAGMVTVETTDVERRGRITPRLPRALFRRTTRPPRTARSTRRGASRRAGTQVRRPARACRPQGLVPAALGGRRAARGRTRIRGRRVGPRRLPFADGWHVPHALDEDGIARLVEQFVAAARAGASASASTSSSSTARTAI